METVMEDLERRLHERICIDAPDVCGMVSWLSEERLGIRFPEPLPLSQEELEDIIRRC